MKFADYVEAFFGFQWVLASTYAVLVWHPVLCSQAFVDWCALTNENGDKASGF
jgi:hypothetical protein